MIFFLRFARTQVLTGKMIGTSSYRVLRSGEEVYKQYAGATLQHYQDEVTEIKHGNECGIGLDFKDIRPGDVVECYTRAEVKQEL